jgi:hypothetical protein
VFLHKSGSVSEHDLRQMWRLPKGHHQGYFRITKIIQISSSLIIEISLVVVISFVVIEFQKWRLRFTVLAEFGFPKGSELLEEVEFCVCWVYISFGLSFFLRRLKF